MLSTVYVVGAGASAGTLGSNVAPCSADFGKTLTIVLPDWQKKFPHLAKVVQRMVRQNRIKPLDWSLETVWTTIDNRLKLIPITRDALLKEESSDDLLMADFELKQASCYIYGERTSSHLERETDRLGVLKHELSGMSVASCVVSFNYDLLVESVLLQPGKKFSLTRDSVKALDPGTIEFVKPHGSVSWKRFLYRQENAIIDEVQFLERPVSLLETRYGLNPQPEIQPGIVGPVPFKDELLWNKDDKFSEILRQQWKRALSSLRQAREIVVMGYAFPAEDYSQALLAQEMLRERRSLRALLVVELAQIRDHFLADLSAHSDRADKAPVGLPLAALASNVLPKVHRRPLRHSLSVTMQSLSTG